MQGDRLVLLLGSLLVLTSAGRAKTNKEWASMKEKEPGPLCDALTTLVEQRRAFVLEREVFPLNTGENWRYWTYELFATDGRRRILVVPVDLREFPQVR